MFVNLTIGTKEKTNNDESEYQKRLYDKYSSERSELNRNALEIGGRYDKAVFILAGGGLGLSVTFIEKIAPNPTILSLVFLAVSWTLLLICLVASLFATSASQNAIQWQISSLDRQYKPLLYPELDASGKADTSAFNEGINPFLKKISRLDVTARWTLVLGTVCLCTFAVLNVLNKENINAAKVSSNKSPDSAAISAATSFDPKSISSTRASGQGDLHASDKLSPAPAAGKEVIFSSEKH